MTVDSAAEVGADATPPSSAPTVDGRMHALVHGIDAALMVTALGLMYALIVYATLGAGALPLSLSATTVAFVVGGGLAVWVGRPALLVAGPTATGALAIAHMAEQLQNVPGVRGHVEAVLLAAAAATVVCGLVQVAFARARLGSALKFVPYPVLMGFVNAVGASLVVSVVPFALGHDHLGRLVQAGQWLIDWRPWALVVAGVGTAAGYAAMRFVPRVPGAFCALVMATLAHRLLATACPTCRLGPTLDFAGGGAWPSFDPAAWQAMSSDVVFGVAWWSIVLQAALTLAVLNALFSLLVVSYLTQAHDRPADGNRLLTTIGAATLGSGLLFGLPIAIITSASLVVRRIGAHRRLAMSTYLVATALVFVVGRRWFDGIPMAAVASSVFVIARSQFDASTWSLIRQAAQSRAARHAARGPLVVVVVVVVVALLRSLGAALFVGALAAVCLLAIELRRSVVLGRSDGRARRSRHVRSHAERERLDALGSRIRVIELGHWLYFGTADELASLLEDEHDARWLLLDARRVAGIDLTAARSLIHAAQRLAGGGARLVLAGLPHGDPRRRSLDALRIGAGGRALAMAADIDEALERAEDDLLASDGSRSPREADLDDAATLPGLAADDIVRLQPWLHERVVRAGETLFEAGDAGDALFIVRRGRITLWLGGDSRARIRLSTFGAGGLFGEMALLDGRARSTWAVADVDAKLQSLSRTAFDAIAATDPAFHARLLQALALQLVQRLRETNALLGQALR